MELLWLESPSIDNEQMEKTRLHLFEAWEDAILVSSWRRKRCGLQTFESQKQLFFCFILLLLPVGSQVGRMLSVNMVVGALSISGFCCSFYLGSALYMSSTTSSPLGGRKMEFRAKMLVNESSFPTHRYVELWVSHPISLDVSLSFLIYKKWEQCLSLH